jgi:FixJ family two-component response regulator
LYRVFIADKDGDNTEALTRLFQEMYGVCPVIWRDTMSYLSFLSGQAEGIVFVRIDKPDLGGLALSREALARQPRVQLAWMADSEAHGVEAFSYGADEYLLLPASEDSLRDVMKTLEHKRKRIRPNALT